MPPLAGGRNDTESFQEQFLALKMVQRTVKRYDVPWELFILGVAVQEEVGNGFLASKLLQLRLLTCRDVH